MKTTRYLMASIMLAGLLTGEAQARLSRPDFHGHYGQQGHFVPNPRLHFRTHIFAPIITRPYVVPHIVTVPPRRSIIVPAPAPVIIHQPAVTIWITNANGSRSPVVLKIDGPWYIGPRGERYASLPGEDQLRPVYGLDCGPMELQEVGMYITTDSGALRRITLTRTANGYRGPNGELYIQMPSEEQLRMAYGR